MTKAGNSQIMRTITLLITIFSLSLPAYAQYSGGTGEPNDPYQISTAEDLMLLGETPDDYDKHFILTADIDLDPNLPGRKIFDKAVIAPDTNDTKDYFEGVSFTGAFDGKSHVISNLHIRGGDYLGYLGLFGQLDSGAMVSNLGLEAVDIKGTGNYVGGLAGQNDGSITTSYSTGTVNGSYGGWYFAGEVGGLVGQNHGSITTSYSTGTVTGKENVGGLAGSNSGSIVKSYSTGTDNGRWNVGGLVGQNYGSIVKSYSTGTVSGDAGVGGFVGINWEEITMSYSTGAVNGDLAVGGFVGLNVGIITTSYSTSMVTGYVETGGLVGQNGVNIPTRERNGAVFNCYSMGAVTGDWAVGGLVGANRLGNVDMSYSTGVVTDTDPNGSTPPLPPDDPFDPIYKGAGGLVGGNISNLTSCFWDIESSGQTTSAGGTGKTTAEMQTASTFLEAGWDFVGETVNGPNDIWKISEGLDYPRLWWQKYGGGTGEPNNPYLIYTAEHLNELGAERNDYSKHFKLMADIDLSGYLYDRAVIAPDMIDSGLQHEGVPFTGVLDGNGHAISNLTIEGHSFLGLFGYLDSDAIVSNLSIEAADVNGISDFVGSLAGFSYGNVIGCCCAGDVSGNDDVGGLVGSNSIGGNITNCYSTVTVSGNEKVGGLVGYTKGSVTMCYSTGMVISEGQNAGGFVGERNPSYGIVTDCFWDTQTSGQATSAGGTGKTTAEMQTENTFTDAGWDFVDEAENGTEDIWWILEGHDYPRLWWEAE